MKPDEKAEGIWQWLLRVTGISSLWHFSWPSLIALTAFAVLFVPTIMGGPGAHQAPLLAFVVVPFIYLVARFLTWLWPRSAKWLLATVLVGGIGYATDTLLRVERLEEAYRAQMMLTEAERSLLNMQPFNLSLAVDANGRPPVYQENLVRDMQARKWFSQVGKAGGIEQPDLIARITGNYFGDKQGHSFTLEWADSPSQREKINVWHWVGTFRKHEIKTLYEERLEMETARAVQVLKTTRSLADRPD